MPQRDRTTYSKVVQMLGSSRPPEKPMFLIVLDAAVGPSGDAS